MKRKNSSIVLWMSMFSTRFVPLVRITQIFFVRKNDVVFPIERISQVQGDIT
jgi:hypothetical protein